LIKSSQSLRKSGQFLFESKKAEYGFPVCPSQSLRKSGQFLFVDMVNINRKANGKVAIPS